MKTQVTGKLLLQQCKVYSADYAVYINTFATFCNMYLSYRCARHTHTHTERLIYISIYIYIHKYVCVYIYNINICIYIYMYIYMLYTLYSILYH